jgi:hypothetical protein
VTRPILIGGQSHRGGIVGRHVGPVPVTPRRHERVQDRMSLADPDAQPARRRVGEVRRLAVGGVEGMLVQRSLPVAPGPAAQSRARMTRRKASTSRVGIS